MKLQEMLNDLNEFTAPPKDGDYDAHTINAMIAVFNYCNQKHTTPPIVFVYEERIKELENCIEEIFQDYSKMCKCRAKSKKGGQYE